METFYLCEDLTFFLLVSSRLINVFPVSQVLIISAAQPLTVSKSQSLQEEWCPKADPTNQLQGSPTSEWKLLHALSHLQHSALTDLSVTLAWTRLVCGHCRPNWPLAKDSSSVLCPRHNAVILPTPALISKSNPCLTVLAESPRRMLLTKIIRTLSNLLSR